MPEILSVNVTRWMFPLIFPSELKTSYNVHTFFSRAPVGFPPRSLHELLERQWEQTAQFILDQAGSQNNGERGLGPLIDYTQTCDY